MSPQNGEALIWSESPYKIGPEVVIVKVAARLPDGDTRAFKFLASGRNFYRKSGPSNLLRPGYYRYMRTEALNRAIEKATTIRKLLPPAGRLDYSQFPTNSAMVEDVRVGPLRDPESLAVFVELLTGDGKKIVAFGKGVKPKGPGKVGLEIVASDTGVTLDRELDSALRVVATKELRRLGVPL
jgi:hypothetical protein